MDKIYYSNEIQSFFEEIVVELRRVLDPEYILIAGSFGKGSWIFDQEVLLSDFEFEFVCKSQWSRQKKTNLLRDLNQKFNFEIDLKGHLLPNVEKKILSNFGKKNQGYVNLNFFDTFSAPQVLYAKNKKSLVIPIDNCEIPVWEAWRLYVNRIGEILEKIVNQNKNQHPENYYWIKVFESIADAYLIIHQIYRKNISERILLFNKELLIKDKDLSDNCRNSYHFIRMALNARKMHDISNLNIEISFDERVRIIQFWLKYFEKKLSDQEEILPSKNDDFYEYYLKNVSLHKKYLEFTDNFAIISSNLIRLVKNPKLINSRFKFYNLKKSWKHLILLAVSSYLNEYQDNNYMRTKNILINIISRKEINLLTNQELLSKLIFYWKNLR